MQSTAQFELALGRTNLPLGKTNIRPGSVTVDGLTEGQDFTVNVQAGTITVSGNLARPFVFVTFEHDQQPVPLPLPLDVGVDAPDLMDRTGLVAWLTATNSYLNNNSPTAAETVAQTKRNARALKAILKRLVG